METREYGIVLILICLFVFILASVMVLFFQVYKTNLLKSDKEKQIVAFRAAVEAEEKQKAKIANDLHDETIHLISATKQQVDKDVIDKKKVLDLLDQTSSGVRAIALDLLPKTLVNFGLINAVEQHAMLLNVNNDRKIDIENNTPFSRELPFSKIDEKNIYRICLEVLNNLRKHAKYKYLLISFECKDELFFIEFSHDGLGVNNKEIESLSVTTTGLGLKSLHSRLLILSAKINYSVGSRTSTIRLTIPYKI